MKIKIGVDFDKIFVDYPPFIPGELINFLYKKRNHHLSYRFPGKLEQKIRIASHAEFLRSPIRTNLESLKKMVDGGNCQMYLISSRFSFLKQRTEEWSKKNNISLFFQKMYFNFKDEQPHIFKDRIIKKEGIRKFIDDDLDLLKYLSSKNPDVKFYWVNSGKKREDLPKNIKKIKDLEEFRLSYL